MDIVLEYDDCLLQITDDNLYRPDLVDVNFRYDFVYDDHVNPKGGYSTKYGIRVLRQGKCIKSAVLMGVGFSGLRNGSFVLSDGEIVLAVGKTVFSLNLPDLSLNWKAEGDESSCFGVYRFENGYVIHGEQTITYLRSDGTLGWKFWGEDIFVSPDGRSVFEICDGYISF